MPEGPVRAIIVGLVAFRLTLRRPLNDTGVMIDNHESTAKHPTRNRLPSPGCLFSTLFGMCLVSVVAWQVWQVKQRMRLQRYLEQIEPTVSI